MYMKFMQLVSHRVGSGIGKVQPGEPNQIIVSQWLRQGACEASTFMNHNFQGEDVILNILPLRCLKTATIT